MKRTLLLEQRPFDKLRAGPGAKGGWWVLLLAALLMQTDAFAKVLIKRVNYRGWQDAIAIDNGKAAVVVVPSIGRVIQFGFKGGEGVFWENRILHGQLADASLQVWASRDWVNFGGDKAWPSPEAEWSSVTGRKGWRPPPAFDGMTYAVELKGSVVLLRSHVDPFYGLEVQRRIELHASKPELTITTTFEHVQGDPVGTGIWVVTQLRHPAGLFAPLGRRPVFRDGFTLLGKGLPPSLVVSNRLLSLRRSTNQAYKIGLDADRLLWVGEEHTLLIESPRDTGTYPDLGSSTEIYTSPDPLQYIELETLGPMRTLKQGQRISHRNVYILGRRRHPGAEPEAEARAILGR